jgi:AcrR family transcriptional regulator
MTVDRRAELVEAGISLLAQQRFQDLLAGVETRAIADEAGVTTGSFFHHFRNRSHFAMAVADAFVDRWSVRVDDLRSEVDKALEPEDVGSGRRPAAAAEWERLTNPGETPVLQHLLWAVRGQPICDDTGRTAGAALRDGYAHITDAVEARYQHGLRRLGREMLPPFTSRDLTVILTAFAEGLQMRHGVDPEAIRDDLYADAVGAILLGVTRPRVERADTEPAPELSTLESRYLFRRRPEPARNPLETWRQIADAAAHLFVDRGPGDVRVSEVAAVAGVSATTVYHHFGNVTAVAASGWARHIPALEEIAAAPITGEEGPIRRIEQVLLRYVQLARENRGATEALAAQVITESDPSSDREWPRSIREVVPLPGILLPLIRELRTVGRLRRRVETERLARSLVHLCTMQSLLFTGESDERIVDETMTLVFDGALVAPSDG